MKFSRTLLLAAALVGGSAAQAQALVATGGLTASPANASMSARGGLSAFKTVTITDSSTSYAANIGVSLTVTGSPLGTVEIIGDTCTGATLAPNGTCTIKLEFDSTCPKAETAHYTLTVTATGFPPLVIPVNGNSQGGICM